MSSQDKTFGKIEKRSLAKNLSKTSPRPPVCSLQRATDRKRERQNTHRGKCEKTKLQQKQ